jgi:predicted ArsR family transcriptional regulator
MARSPAGPQLADIALLGDPVRRRLYLYVVDQPHEVGRVEAAKAAGISRPAAAFHLEKLVEGGLLEGDYRRLTGRRGPGAGRPARIYRRAQREVHIDLPPRDYELLARFLVRGLGPKGKASERTHRAAREFGAQLGTDARRRAGRDPSRKRRLSVLTTALRERGFDPQPAGPDRLTLRNCPFDALSADYRDLVCPLNLSLMQGVLEGLGDGDLEAVLDRKPGMCCVVFQPTQREATAG